MKSLSDVIWETFIPDHFGLNNCGREDYDMVFRIGVSYSEDWSDFSEENPEYYTPVILDTKDL